MKSIEIKGSLRTDLGKKGTRELRKSNGVPCVLYGVKKDENGLPVATHFSRARAPIGVFVLLRNPKSVVSFLSPRSGVRISRLRRVTASRIIALVYTSCLVPSFLVYVHFSIIFCNTKLFRRFAVMKFWA